MGLLIGDKSVVVGMNRMDSRFCGNDGKRKIGMWWRESAFPPYKGTGNEFPERQSGNELPQSKLLHY